LFEPKSIESTRPGRVFRFILRRSFFFILTSLQPLRVVIEHGFPRQKFLDNGRRLIWFDVDVKISGAVRPSGSRDTHRTRPLLVLLVQGLYPLVEVLGDGLWFLGLRLRRSLNRLWTRRGRGGGHPTGNSHSQQTGHQSGILGLDLDVGVDFDHE